MFTLEIMVFVKLVNQLGDQPMTFKVGLLGGFGEVHFARQSSVEASSTQYT